VSHALLIVDVQNDFLPPDGALAVPSGDEVIEPINELVVSPDFDLVIATRDWHPPDHASFESQGGVWPAHCVRDTLGAQLSPYLDQGAVDAIIDKGTAQGSSGYSAFESERLRELLRDRRVQRLTLAGLATEFCVKHTALDALAAGLEVRIPTLAVRGIDPTAASDALQQLAAAGADLVTMPERATSSVNAAPGR
jgi:nicotinamidase/pyrazinamidase